MKRRTFIHTSLGAGAVLALPPLLQACAEAGRSAGSTRPRPLGVQLYTVRDLMAEDVPGTLAAVADIGYREVEFAGYFNHDPRDIRAWLDAEGLVAPSGHFFVDDWEPVFELATVVGHDWVIQPWIAPEDRETLDGYRRLAERFNEIGSAARAAGLQFGYHNHDFEFAPLEGRIPIEVLLEETDPDLVQLQMDLFWITNGGGNPFDYFAAWPGRVTSVHVKDRLADGTMVDVGDGAIDFAGIFAESEAAGIQHYFVEHDTPDPPLESIRRSYQHLARIMAGG